MTKLIHANKNIPLKIKMHTQFVSTLRHNKPWYQIHQAKIQGTKTVQMEGTSSLVLLDILKKKQMCRNYKILMRNTYNDMPYYNWEES